MPKHPKTYRVHDPPSRNSRIEGASGGFAAGLALLGGVVIVFAFLMWTFSCYTVTDASCQADANGRSAPVFILGGLLLAGSFVSALRRRP